MLDLLKEEMNQTKLNHQSNSDQINCLKENINTINEQINNLEDLEKKIKKKISKKEMQEILNLTKDDLVKNYSMLSSQFANIKKEIKLMNKSKLNKEDLSYFLIKKVDNESFTSQIDLLTESLIALKKKMTILQSQSELLFLNNLPVEEDQNNEIKHIKQIEQEENFAIKLKEIINKDIQLVQQEINIDIKTELNKLKSEQSKRLTHIQNMVTQKGNFVIIANQSKLEQLLDEQAKLNDFICAENILARFKVTL